MPWNLSGFVAYLRALQSALGFRRRTHKPITRDRRPAKPSLDVLDLERREYFNDVSLGGIVMAAGAGGAAAVLFRSALMRVGEPVAQARVDMSLVEHGPADLLTDDAVRRLPEVGAGWEPDYFRAEARWSAPEPGFVTTADIGTTEGADAFDSFFGRLGDANSLPDDWSNPSADHAAALLAGLTEGNPESLEAGSRGFGAADGPRGTLDAAVASPAAGHAPDAAPDPALTNALALHNLGATRGENVSAGTSPVAALPPMDMTRFPFAGTGGTIQSLSPTAPLVPGANAGTLEFVANHGQADPQFQFVGQAPGFSFSLSADGITYNLDQPGQNGKLTQSADAVQMQFVGANATPQLVGLNPVTPPPAVASQPGGGSNGTPVVTPAVPVPNPTPPLPSSLLPTLPNSGALPTGGTGTAYSQVNYQAVYAGINFDVYANAEGQLEFDWVVAAGADPGQIRVQFQNADQLSLDAHGNLQILTATGGGLVMHAPVVYQQFGGIYEPVEGHYVLDGNQVGFSIATYDHSRTLVIDPVLTASGTLQPSVVLPAGNTPRAAASADFNNDGTDDVVIANFAGADLTVATGQGDGTFAPGVSLATGNGPTGLAVGDLVGNGEHDIVVAQFTDSSVGVLRSNGDGTFQPVVSYAVSGGPTGAALGDFNDDGSLDIATANYTAGTMSVLLNNGDGTFATPVSYTAGAGAISIVARDLNDDGVLDLATANAGADSVSVLVGNNDGTFQTAVSYAVGTSPYAIVAGDFRGDGAPDLLTANFGDDSVSRLVNNGDGTFQAATNVAVGSNPTSLAVGDFNGRPDVVVGNYGSDDVSLLLTNADGSFQPEQRFPAGSGPSGVAVGDFNGDGRLSIVVADQDSDSFSVLLTDTVQATEDEPFDGVVARFTSSDSLAQPGDFSATIDWGDGNTTAGTVEAGLAGDFVVVGTHTYENGSYAVLVTIEDNQSDTATAVNLAIVTDINDPTVEAYGTTLSGTEGAPLTNVVVATFTDPGGAEALPTPLLDTGFETPNVGTGSFGAFQYNPSGTPWTFSAGSGVAGNGSGFTSGNPNAPDGTQVGFLQGTSSISQALVLAAGQYTVRIRAAQRGNYQASSQTFNVLIDGTVVGTFTPTGTSYEQDTTASFSVTAGTHTLAFVGLNPNGGDNTVFLDAVAVEPASTVSATDAGFETPSVGTGSYGAFQYNPTGAPWTFTGGSGVAGNGSGFTSGNPDAPQGTQVAFLQSAGSSISQSIAFSAGTYTVSFLAAQRGNHQPAGPQTVQVLLDGDVLGTFTPAGTSYALQTTDSFTVTGGNHTLTFVGQNSGDTTAFIDQVTIGTVNTNAAYTATIDWGDGSAPQAGTITFDSQTGVFSVTGSHVYAHHGDYVATTTITNDGRAVDALTNVHMAEAAITLLPGTFAAPAHYAAGNTPDGVATGDLNGDDIPDVVVANFNGGSLSVFLANGDGTLSAATNYTTGSGPNGIVIADFNSDLVHDIVVGNFNDSTATVYLGTGTGTFTLGGTYATGSNPANRTALGDFNGDSFLDVAFADQGDSSISVLFGNGDGTFAAPVVYATGRSGTDAVVAGDFNDDDSLDLAAANYGDSTVSVFLNDGTGTFATPVTYSVGANPFDIDVLPLGPDGNVAIATANFNGNSVSVLAGNGDGTFQTAVNYSVGANPTSLAAGAFNGVPVLAVGNFGSSQVSVLAANEDGTFQPAQNYATGSGPNGIALADLDGNGLPDVVTANQNGNTASVLLNQAIQATGGQLFTGKVASFTDANPLADAGNFSVLIDWGDGNIEPGLVVANDVGGFDVFGSHFYEREGAYQVNAQVTGSLFGLTALAYVGDAPLLAEGNDVRGFVGQPTEPITVATFIDTDPRATVNDFRPVTINWGDGTTSTGTVVQNPDSTFSVQGTHAYAAAGVYTVSLTIFDKQGATVTTTSKAIISDASNTFATIQGSAFNDLNGNKLFQSGKPALPGWTVNLLNNLNQVIATTQTAADGTYSFGSLVAGTYAVQLVGQSGWTATAAPTNSFSVQAGLTYVVNFGTFQNTSISGYKTNSQTGLAIAGLKICLHVLTNGQLSATELQETVTDANGYYFFANLPPLLRNQQYVVTEAPGGFYRQTLPLARGPNTIILPNGLVGYVIPPQSGVPVTLPGDIRGTLTGPGSVRINGFNNGTAATIYYNVNGQSDTVNTLLSQFNVTYTGAAGTPVTFNTFCFDVLHRVTGGQTYVVDPRADLNTAFANGNRLAYLYQTFGWQNLAGQDTKAAGLQVAFWVLATDPNNPTALVDNGDGTYSDGNPNIFWVSFGGNPDTQAIVTWANYFLGLTPTTTTLGAWLNSSAYGAGPNPGQNVFIPQRGDNFADQPAVRWKATSTQLRDDPKQAVLVPFSTAQVSTTTGSLRTKAGLCLNCGCAGCNDKTLGVTWADLYYNSATVNVRPVINAVLTMDPSVAIAPSSIDVRLTFGDGQIKTVTFFPTTRQAQYVLPVQLDQAITTSGIYGYTVEITAHLPACQDIVLTTSGLASVVSNDSSPFGAGWSIDSLYRLAINSNGVLMISGTGDSRMFTPGPNGTFVGQRNDFGRLTQLGTGYRYTDQNQEQWDFDSAGLLTQQSVPSARNKPTRWVYQGGKPQRMILPNRDSTTFQYTPLGQVDTITGPGNRQFTLGYDSNGFLNEITDPAGGLRSLVNSALGQLTGDPWGPLDSTYTYDPNTGLVTHLDQGLGDTLDVTSALQRALTAASPLSPDQLVGTTVDGLGRTTTYTQDDLGRLLKLQTPDNAVQTWQRDAAGDVVAYTDELGHTTRMAYDGFGDVLGVTNPDGSQAHFTYDNFYHQVTSYTDTLSHVTHFSYDVATGDLLRMTDALGETTIWVWSEGLLMSVTDALGRVTRYRYLDGLRKVLSMTDALGHTTTYGYDLAENPATITDALGRTTTFVYDGMRRVTEATDAAGGVITFTYNAIGEVTSQTDQLGRETATTYDQRGFVTSVTEAVGTPVARTTTISYDAVGNVTAVVDALGRATHYAYDLRDRPTEITEAFGTAQQRSTFLSYDLVGNLLSLIDPRGFVTAFVYDNRDRLIETTEAVGTAVERSTFFTYDSESNLRSMTDALGRLTQYSYDALNRQVAMTEAVGTPLERTTSVTYDQVGNVVSSTDALGRETLYVYSAVNLLVSLTEAAGTPVERTTTFAYDAVYHLVETTDPLGRQTDYTYDALDREIAMTEAVGTSVERTTTFAYDAVSNFVGSTDALGRVTQYAYDALNREVSMTEAVGTSVQRTTTVAYDAVSNVVSTTDALGRTTQYVYDALYRMTSVTEAVGSSVQRTTTLAYDVNNNVIGTIDALGRTTQYVYDALNRETSMTEAVGTSIQRATSMAYDAVDNLVSFTDALGRVSAYGYDALNRTVSMTEAVGTSVQRTFTLAYDAVDNLVSQTDALGRTTQYAYDALNRAVSITEAVGASVQRTTTMAYDAVDNLVGFTDALGRTTQYVYDALYRTVSITEAVGTSVQRTTTFAYDAVSNFVGSTDALGRVTQYAYDALNRAVSITEAVGTPVQRTMSMAYDAVDNLVSTTDALGRTTQYVYDALYREVSFTEAIGTSVQRTTTFAYDAVSNFLGSTDALGRITAYSYDALDREISMTEAVGTPVERTTTFAYDAVSNLVSITDALGRVADFAYDALNREVAMTEAVGSTVQRTTSMAYDAMSNLVSITDALGRVTAFAYDALDREISMTEAVGTPVERTTTFAYDAVSNLVSITDALGRITQNVYDALNRTVAMTEAVGTSVERTASMAYDAVDNLVSQTDALGRVTAFSYDALNREVTMTEAVGTSVQRTTTMAYDAVDNLVGFTDALGRTTQYVYDALYRTVSITEAVGTSVQRTTTFAYDAVSNFVGSTDALGRVTQYAYDALNRAVSITEAVGTPVQRTMSMAYDAVDNLVSTTDALGRTTQYVYDALYREVSFTEAIGTSVQRTTTFAYDAVSNFLGSTDALGRITAYSYDALDREISMTEAVGTPVERTTTFAYDAVSNLVSITDALGRVADFAYDALNREVAMTEAVGSTVQRTTSMAYDAMSNLVSITDALGRVTAFAYDALDREISMTEAVGTPVERTTTFAYDAVSNLVSITDALGRITQNVYDALNRTVAMTEAVGTSVERTASMAYDAVDNLVSQTDALGRVTAFSYDALNREVTMTEAVGTSVQRTTTMAYDAVDNLVGFTDALGRTTQYVYDALYRTVSITEAVGTSVQRTTTFAYDAVSNFVGSTDALGRVTQYAYDALNRAVSITEAVGTPVQRTMSMAYDAVDNLVSTTDALGRTTQYVYDALYREVSFTEAIGTSVQRTTTFAYDAVSNFLGSTDALGRITAYSYDALDREISMTEAVGTPVERTTTFAYDAVSNLVSITDALGRVADFAYDALNREVAMTEAVGSTVQRTTSMAYDAMSNLVSITDALGRVTAFAYDALDREISMTEAVGTPVERTTTFAYDAVSNLVSITDALGRITQNVYDALNRTVAMTEAVGTSVERTASMAYDAVDNLVSQTDALGRVTAFSYDALNREVTMTEAVGTSVQRTTTMAYDAVDNLVGFTDALGRTTQYVYDALYRTVSITEAVGTSVQRTTTFAYDAVSNFVGSTDALGRVTQYAYDALNRAVSITEAVGTPVQRTMSMAYDAVDNLVSQTDALGRVSDYSYDALNREVSMTEAVGTSVQRTTTLAYDAVDNLVSLTDALGRMSQYTYDALNRETTMTEAVGTSVQRTTTMAFDAVDNLVSRTDALGHTTHYVYDALNRYVTTTDALGQSVTIIYDLADNVTGVTNARGFATQYVYDALNRQVERIDALGQTATMVYDAVNNVTAAIDERGNTTTYSYDALNRQTARTDALGHTASIVYDGVDNVLASIDALGFAATFTYDALNRQVTATAPSGGVTTLIYDAVDNVTSSIDPLGHATTYVYDALNRQTGTIDAIGGITTVIYDAVDNQTGFIDPVGNHTTMVYDALNREVEVIDPLGHSVTMAYDAADRLVSRTDRDDRRIDFSYDAINRDTGETWTASNGTTIDNTLSYSYDANDNLLTASDSHGTYTMTYDALDRLATQTDVFGLTLTFGYDAVGNQVSQQDSLGGVTTSVYDAVNRLTTRAFGGTGQTPLRMDFTYTARYQLATETRYSDLAGTQLVGESAYTYDGTGRLTSINHLDASSNVLASYVYAYDVADRLTSETMNGLTRYYVYDATNQITSDDGTGHSYDLNGNRTDSGYGTGPNNQLLSDGTWNYSYDAEGSLVKKINISTAETWTYGYDERNQMTFAEQRATDGGTLLQRVDFGYDVFGNRINTAVATGSGTTTQQFAYDVAASGMGNVWADLDGSGSLTTRRVYGDGVDQPLARTMAAGVASWYIVDHLGSVVGIVSNATGALIDQIAYDAFGNIKSESNPANGDRYKYTAREFDSETGLQYTRARYLDPQTGRFTSEDPIGGSNLYVYAGNGPTNATDPSGLQEKPATIEQILRHFEAYKNENDSSAFSEAAFAPGAAKKIEKHWAGLTQEQRMRLVAEVAAEAKGETSEVRRLLEDRVLERANTPTTGSCPVPEQLGVLPQEEGPTEEEQADTIRRFEKMLPPLLEKARKEQEQRDLRAAELKRQIEAASKKYADNAARIQEIDRAIEAMRPQIAVGKEPPTLGQPARTITRPDPNWDPTKDERAVALLIKKAQLEGDQKKVSALFARADELHRIANMDVEARFKHVLGIMKSKLTGQAAEYVQGLIENIPQIAAMVVILGGVSAINPALGAGIGYLLFGHSVLELGGDVISFLFGTLGARTEEDFEKAATAGNNVVIQAGATLCTAVGARYLKKRMQRAAEKTSWKLPENGKNGTWRSRDANGNGVWESTDPRILDYLKKQGTIPKDATSVSLTYRNHVPDFRPYIQRIGNTPAEVKITLNSDKTVKSSWRSRQDYRAADEKYAQLLNKQGGNNPSTGKPWTGKDIEAYRDKNALTWHHVDDVNVATGEGSMQLVPRSVHKYTYHERGGRTIYDRALGVSD